MTLTELAADWKARVSCSFVSSDVREAVYACANELSEAIRDRDNELLSPKEAAAECALAEKTIRKMLSDGRLVNAGTRGRPKVRRGELHAAANRSVARRLAVVK